MHKIIVHHHLGLGDHFICNGLVNFLCLKYNFSELHLVTKKHNEASVNDLYSSNSTIKTLIFDPNEIDEDIFSTRISNVTGIPLLKITSSMNSYFDRHFYESIGLNFDLRWKYFTLPKDQSKSQAFFEKKCPSKEYCLVSNSSSVGEFALNINTYLNIIKVERLTESLLDWIVIIMNAKEIHAIDSSFIHLADSLILTGKALFYHEVNRGSKFYLKNNWTRINYKNE